MIKYEPSKLIKKIAPDKKIKKLLNKNFSLRKAALSFVNDVDFIGKGDVTRVALKTIKGYKNRIKADKDLKKDILSDPRQLIQRVQNEVVLQVADEIKSTY